MAEEVEGIDHGELSHLLPLAWQANGPDDIEPGAADRDTEGADRLAFLQALWHASRRR